MLRRIGSVDDRSPHARTKRLPGYFGKAEGNTVKNPNMRILDLLVSLCTWKGKTYCFPSHDRLRELLAERYHVKMSVRTLIRHLNSLRRDFMLQRIVRHKEHPRHGWTFHSSLYYVLPRAITRLGRTAMCTAKMLKSLLISAPSFRVTKMADKLRNYYESVLPKPIIASAR